MSSRSRRAFLVTALQDAEAWERFVAHAGFVVDQRLEAPLGPDGTMAALEGTVLLVLKQRTEAPQVRPGVALRPLGPWTGGSERSGRRGRRRS